LATSFAMASESTGLTATYKAQDILAESQ